jgi:hydrogenase maturation protein HypF
MSKINRLLITVCGSVQGVGFRPFVYRLANLHHLVGNIRNTNRGVDIDVQGSIQDLSGFQHDLVAAKPERAIISEIFVTETALHDAKSFEIEMSDNRAETTLALLPDSAICPTCLQELADPHNRRYRYPFLHCMTCGPRFSIFLRMPFDRQHTTMTDFSMCELCKKEYGDPSDRRFYSQTNCCPHCGPKLKLFDPQRKILASENEALDSAIEFIRQGKILAVKNTGGFLLLADATNADAVNRLRSRKRRAKKPFALLMPSLSSARQAAEICPIAEQVLLSPAAPIVLVKKRPGGREIVDGVSCESPYYGMMLPHNALQYLLMGKLQRPLIATSGNISGKPLCITEEEAFKQLSGVADAFLVHNRRIIHRVDDSIVQIIAGEATILRRARGYIPYLINLPLHLSAWTIAAGGHLKNSFALAKDRHVYGSQYIGNLDSTDACQVYDQEVASWESLLNMTPSQSVSDLHPDYYTSRYLQKRSVARETVQHHRAHLYSGMLDNQLSFPLLGFSWDGTGLGDDQTIWGSEAFLVTESGARHFATLYPFSLPGSEKAIREPRRAALGLLNALFGSNLPPLVQNWTNQAFSNEELGVLSTALAKGINAPVCSSMGRLFDGVSAILSCCLISDFEGHAALALENLANGSENEAPRYKIHLIKKNEIWLMDWREMIQRIFEDRINKIPLADIALSFHLALAQTIKAIAWEAGMKNVLLSGGVMQNRLLSERAIAQLRQGGFQPYWHHAIPPNDGGLAIGQIGATLYQSREGISFP